MGTTLITIIAATLLGVGYLIWKSQSVKNESRSLLRRKNKPKVYKTASSTIISPLKKRSIRERYSRVK